MAVLLLLLTWLSPVLQAMGSLPPPVILSLTSDHFIHLLRWKAGAGTPPGASYRVRMNKDTGTSWLPVAGCQNVVDPLLCNLTKVFSDPSETYYAEVTAHLGSETSPPVIYEGFQPISDTVLDPPLVSVTPCDKNLCVQLTAPLEHLRHVYETLKYNISVGVTEDARQDSVVPASLKEPLVLKYVAPGRQYCVSVCLSKPPKYGHSHRSQPVCIVTPSDFKPDALVWSLLSVLTLLGVSLLAFFVYSGFICLKKKPLPSTLTTLHHIEEALIFASPLTSSFSPLYEDKSTAPPGREKRSSSTSSSESSDEESTQKSTGGGGREEGGGYLSKKGTNLPSSSSSSSSSLVSAPSVPLSAFSNLPSHSLTPLPPPLPPQAQDAAETAPLAGQAHKLNTHSADRTPPTHTVSPPAGGEEEVRDCLNVDLFTLTFDRNQEVEESEEEEEEEACKGAEFSSNMNPFLLPQRVVDETVPCPEDEDEEEEEDEDEEEEETSGYIRH